MNSVAKLIMVRSAFGVLTLFVVSLVIFFVVELLPGDAAEAILGQAATPETVANLRQELGLDRPAVARYLDWIAGFITGDFGTSLASGRPVADLMSLRFRNTAFLAAYSAAMAIPIALTFGVLTALWRDSLFDRLANIVTLSFISFPDFFVAYVLILALALTGLFPSFANTPPDATLGQMLYQSFLPALTVTLVVTAHMMRMTRAAIINVVAAPYMEMAQLKGLSPTTIITRHALPNALGPIINVVAINLAYLFTGLVVVEIVFAFPGLGQMMVDSVSRRDLPVVQAVCLVFAAVYIFLNVLADLMVLVTNPRMLHKVSQ